MASLIASTSLSPTLPPARKPSPGTEGYPLNLRLAARSNLRPFYRSDSTFLERLHWEGAIDLPPERSARQVGERFGS
jgi:hypothetical protein